MKKILLVLVAISTNTLAQTPKQDSWTEYCETLGGIAAISQTMRQSGKTESETYETLMPLAKMLEDPEYIERQLSMNVTIIKSTYKAPIADSMARKRVFINVSRETVMQACMEHREAGLK